jgi:hypothetical protein
MSYIDNTESRGSDPLTTVIAGLLALAALALTIFCLGYAVWWLWVYWAPW